MRDGPGLRALKRVLLWQYLLDLSVRRAVWRLRGERPWILAGQCRRAARCCEAPAIEAGLLTWSLPVVRRIFLAWQRRINGFDLTQVDGDSRVFVFRCRHFDWTSRACDSYDSRPGICRDYPRHLLWQANPQLHRHCGYRALPPNAAGLRSAIDALEVAPEQKEKLRRGLRLEG